MPIGSVRGLEGGEIRQQDFDVSQVLFCTLEVRVFVDDAPYRRRSMYFERKSGGVNMHSDASGRFKSAVPAGRYRPNVYLDGIRTPVDTPIEVPPGEDIVRVIHVRTRSVRLEVVGSDGKPRGPLRLWVGYPDTGRSAVKIEKAGYSIRCVHRRVTIWAMPKGQQGGSKQHVEVASFAVKPGTGPQVVRVKLPDSLGY